MVKKAISIIFTGLSVIAVIIGFWQKQNIVDAIKLRNYSAPVEIAKLATDTTMTDYGRKLWYLSQPILDDKTKFVGDCSSAEQSIVLGCYVSDKGIFVLRVTDNRLSGIQEVTSAHEMLHAAYERLSDNDKKDVDSMTNKAYQDLKDDRVIKNIEAYRSRDSKVVPNELHSILATEVEKLPSDLEKYYQKYFNNRLRVIEYSKNYEKVFTGIKDNADTIESQIISQKRIIDEQESSIKNQTNQLESDRRKLDQLLSANKRDEYNAQAKYYNQNVKGYNQLVTQYKQSISNYNDLVNKYNNLALIQKQLISAIDAKSAQ